MIWPTKLKIFTNWLYTEKLADPWPYTLARDTNSRVLNGSAPVRDDQEVAREIANKLGIFIMAKWFKVLM